MSVSSCHPLINKVLDTSLYLLLNLTTSNSFSRSTSTWKTFIIRPTKQSQFFRRLFEERRGIHWYDGIPLLLSGFLALKLISSNVFSSNLKLTFMFSHGLAGLGFFLSALDLPQQHFNMLGSKLLPPFPYSRRSEEKRFWKKLELNSGRRASQETTQITWPGLHVQKLGQTCRGGREYQNVPG